MIHRDFREETFQRVIEIENYQLIYIDIFIGKEIQRNRQTVRQREIETIEHREREKNTKIVPKIDRRREREKKKRR